MQSTVRAYESAFKTMPTRDLTRTLEHALTVHQPPLVRGRRIKLRYAHQGGRNPPRIIIHGNQTNAVPDAYTRYLANVFRKHFDLLCDAGVRRISHRLQPVPARTARQAARGAAAAPLGEPQAPLTAPAGARPSA